MLELPPGLGYDRSLQRSRNVDQTGSEQLASRDTEAITQEAFAGYPGENVQYKQRKSRDKGRRKKKPATSTCNLVAAARVADGAGAARPALQHQQDGIAAEMKSTEESEAEKFTSTNPIQSCTSVQAKQLLPASSEVQRRDAGSLFGKSALGRVGEQGWIDEAVLSATARPGGSSKRCQAELPGPPRLGNQLQPQSGSCSPSTTFTHAQGNQHRRKAIQGAVHGSTFPMRRSSLEESQETAANPRLPFERHWKGKKLQQALKRGTVLRCTFRVNATDRRQGYAGLHGLPCDIAVQGLSHQNRAIAGDEVAVRILPTAEWNTQRVSLPARNCQAPDGVSEAEQFRMLEEKMASLAEPPALDTSEPWLSAGTHAEAIRLLAKRLEERRSLRAVGKVVAVLESSPRRDKVVGVLRGEERRLLLLPIDPRMPRGLVHREGLPAQVKAMLQARNGGDEEEGQVLVSAMIDSWQAGSFSPVMVVRESIGQAGEIQVETKALLEMEGVDTEDFGPDVLACLPSTPWQISGSEIAKRRDLRSLRVFSIDPPTARDLDDALSVESLPGGSWRVGVHIADVSHFIPPGSALDAKATLRATSVYLVQRVIPMLPPLLCEQLCSLNPGVDRLAFSIIWELSPQGDVLSQWVGRTVIRSAVKLAYPHAQAMLDGEFAARKGEQPPTELEAPHTWPEVVSDVRTLNSIARHLHRRRFEAGALRLDNVKLGFELDQHGNPTESHIHEQQEANELVAEFMLLANMSVAQLIGRAFPQSAMLRRHPTPDERKMGELEIAAQRLGYKLDTTSAGTIQESLDCLRQAGEDRLILDILQLIATKPMKQAQYFSTGAYPERGDWCHYALAVPMYTHFTSPIRRYPDVIVHRLLAALLEQDPAAAACVSVAYGREQPSSPPNQMSKSHRRPKQSTRHAAAALAKLSENGEPQEQEEIAQGSVGPLALAGEDDSQHGTVTLSEHEGPLVSMRASQGRANEQQVAQEELWKGTSSSGGSVRSAASEDESPEGASGGWEQFGESISSLPPSAQLLIGSQGKALAGQAPTVLQDVDGQAVAKVIEVTEASEAAEDVGGSHGSAAGSVPRNLARTCRESKHRQATERRRHEWGARSLGAKGQHMSKRAVADVPVSAVMLTNEELQKVAKHCNERKTAAKSCSDSSSRLYLSVLLRARPTVAEAIVISLNGNRFFDVYVPLLGLEARILVSEIKPTAEGHWVPDQRVLALQRKVGQEGTAHGGAAPCLADVANTAQLHNPAGLLPGSLPLDIRAFCRLPIVVSAKSPGNAKPLSTYGILFLEA